MKKKKHLGEPVRKASPSASASKSSPKKAPGFPATSSRKKAPVVMSIYAKPGTKVTPIYKDGKPLNGYAQHQEQVAKYLPEGSVYTVDYTDVGSWQTDVYLVEVPGVAFNSVCLADAPDLAATARDRDCNEEPAAREREEYSGQPGPKASPKPHK